VAGVDTSDRNRVAFEERWGVPAYATVTELATEHNVDLACISTPSETHADAIRAAVDIGVSGILCEKPVTTETAAGADLVELCESADVPLAVNYTRRYAPGCRDAREAIRAGELGSVHRAVFTYTKGFLENGSHMVDLARWWFGDLDRVADARTDVEADATLWIDDVACEVVGTGTHTYSYTAVDVYGSEGSLHLIDEGNVLLRRVGQPDPVFDGFEKLMNDRRFETGIYRALLTALDDLVATVRDGSPLVCSGEDALRTLEVCEEVLEGSP
jgi:myo-inositol 2-dehydrogenase/D-chiro-inositol 1-dehydrogenase